MTDSQHSILSGFGRRRRLRAQICAERERLYRIAWSWCHDSSQAEDLAQETMARGLAKFDSLRDESRLQVWLTQILANLFRDQCRRIQPEQVQEHDLPASEDDPEQSTDRKQLIDHTRSAIATLKNDQRQVLTLIDVAGFSYTDTAAILDVPVGTVMSRLSRARGRMREVLQQRGIGRADVVPMRKSQ